MQIANFGAPPSVHLSEYINFETTINLQMNNKWFKDRCEYGYYGSDGQHGGARGCRPDGNDSIHSGSMWGIQRALLVYSTGPS